MEMFGAILGLIGLALMITAAMIWAIQTGGLLGLAVVGFVLLGVGALLVNVWNS